MLTDDHPTTVLYKLTHPFLQDRAGELSSRFGLKLIPAVPSAKENDEPVLRITKTDLVIEYGGETFFFHPSMALLRMINIRRGEGDRFLQAVNLQEGDSILDATMGLASDALISSWLAGNRGEVIAVESSPLIYLIVKEGLVKLQARKPGKKISSEKEKAWTELGDASARIRLICADHTAILREMSDKSVDVVYFDPMFRNTVTKSSSIKPIKSLSAEEPLKAETIREACRVARKRVVLKERKNSGEFERLGFQILDGGQYSSVGFGVIDLDTGRGDDPCSP